MEILVWKNSFILGKEQRWRGGERGKLTQDPWPRRIEELLTAVRYFSRKSSSFIAAGVELREAKSRRHSWMLRQTTLTSDERPLYFFDFPPEVLFFPYGTMPRVTSPIFQTHDEAHTHIYARTLFPTTSTTTIIHYSTRKRVRGGGQRSWKPWYLISGDRLKFSFPRAISLRHGRDVRTYVYIYFEFTFDSMNYCDIPTNCRPLIYSPPPSPLTKAKKTLVDRWVGLILDQSDHVGY